MVEWGHHGKTDMAKQVPSKSAVTCNSGPEIDHLLKNLQPELNSQVVTSCTSTSGDDVGCCVSI